jgi:hypothetical protein
MAPAEDEFHLSDLTPILQRVVDNFFGPRVKINRMDWILLQKNPDFLERLASIRREERIPKLDMSKDSLAERIGYDVELKESQESFYLWDAGAKKQKRVEAAIKAILYDYGLPLNFFSFILYSLLYQKSLKGTPRYNWDFIDQVIENPDELRRIPLSTVEKKYWKEVFSTKVMAAVKDGRVPEVPARAAIREFRKMLAASPKNERRRARVLDSALDIADLKTQPFIDTDGSEKKKTYVHIAGELGLLPDAESLSKEKQQEQEAEQKRVAARLRKQQSRLPKHLKKPKK